MIPNGFKECGYIKFNGNFSQLHARIRNTGDNKEVPPKVIVKTNELLVEREEEMIDQFLKVDTSECEPKEVESMDEAENNHVWYFSRLILQNVNSFSTYFSVFYWFGLRQ